MCDDRLYLLIETFFDPKAYFMRRSRQEIIVGIVKACAGDDLPIGRLMSLVNLPHGLLGHLLDELALARLVEVRTTHGKRRVQTTAKGLVALRYYRNAIALLNGADLLTLRGEAPIPI